MVNPSESISLNIAFGVASTIKQPRRLSDVE